MAPAKPSAMRFVLVLLAAALVVQAAWARSTEDRSSGALLVFSRTLSAALVQSMNVSVSYAVHNVGAKPAIRVALRDNSFPASRFEHVTGSFRHIWPSIKAGETGTLDVVVTPKRAGELYVNPPSISYKDAGKNRVSRLASADTLVVEDHVTYRRRTDRHRAEWASYAGALAALVLLPYLAYVARMPKTTSTVPSKKQ